MNSVTKVKMKDDIHRLKRVIETLEDERKRIQFELTKSLAELYNLRDEHENNLKVMNELIQTFEEKPKMLKDTESTSFPSSEDLIRELDMIDNNDSLFYEDIIHT